MNMVTVKTADLIGPALDWAVAQTDNLMSVCTLIRKGPIRVVQLSDCGLVVLYSPSTDWSQCGPLIEKYPMKLMPNDWSGGPAWLAWIKCAEPDEHITLGFNGDTPLIAACRAIVAAKLGDQVQMPAALVKP